MTAVTVEGARLTVTFDRFDLDSYALFLRTKALPESEIAYDWERDAYTLTCPARFAAMLGAQAAVEERERLPLAPHLFRYQQWCVERAVERERFALWMDTGLGKTHVFTEWARQVAHLSGGRVLILSPLQIIPQTQELARDYFGLEIERLGSRDALAAWCIAPGSGIGIASHHALVAGQMSELRYLAGLVLDESSILKSGGGVIKWNLIKSARGIPYKLSATATPAPNDTMEYASQAAFLEKLRNEGDILWTYFSKDNKGEWYIKPHARDAFYRFMASWSIYIRDPKNFGFEDILATLPPPEVHEYAVPITDVQRELMQGLLVRGGKGMFNDRLGVSERSKLSQLAKGFLYDSSGTKRLTARVQSHKPRLVADLVRQDVADGLQVLVWTVFDEESALLLEELQGDGFAVDVLDGGMSDAARLDALERFRRGELRALISKASLIGYGMNLQFVRSMVFSGFDDSFERMYQATRRAIRFGQEEVVRVHIPYVPELEGMIFNNIRGKEQAFLRDVTVQEQSYMAAMGMGE